MTNKPVFQILAMFLAICLVFSPVHFSQKVKTEDIAVSTATHQPFIKSKAKTEFSLLSLGSGSYKWYAGKKIFTHDELSYLLYQAGFRGLAHKVAYGVAMKESTGRPSSFNGICYGLFQIYMIGSTGRDRLRLFHLKKAADLFDPMTAAKAAYFMSNGGKVWTAWGIDLKTGHGLRLIRRFMPQYPGIVTRLPKQG